MTLWAHLARASNAAGDEIILRRRDDVYEIRYNGLELMSNVNHSSEILLAERTLRLPGHRPGKVLVGGLGMGFTLRACLDQLDDDAEVVVCELVAEVVVWNRTQFGHLAGHPMRDPRVSLRMGDVMETLRQQCGTYDTILMDTDNGPDFTVRPSNEAIYRSSGIETVKRALTEGGVVAFWSATLSPAFERELDRVNWHWRRDEVTLEGERNGAFHAIYLASTDAGKLRSPE